NHTWATVTLQNYFRMYEKLAGMTGTAETEASEFASTYSLPVVPIPTNLPLIRADEPDLVFKTEDAKFAAVVEDIVERNEQGQPILVGTASVAKSEHLSRLLSQRGIIHEVLNAKQHFREAEVVAQAGRLGAVTVATNMAGRGVDIILGGNPELLARHEAMAKAADAESDDGRAELDKLTEEYQERCKSEGDQVRESGGLYVLGSERHESRRIDNQLRGRSGRQGDPGESRFFLSLEDDLMRLFATGAMNWVMAKALPEDVPIEAKMVSKAIERAQNTVEGKNSEARKDLLKYDEVMNEQRKVIYANRLAILEGEDLHERTAELLEETLESLVQQSCPTEYHEEWDLEHLIAEVTQYYPTQFTTEDLEEATTVAQITESLVTEALEYYDTRSAEMPDGEETARQIEREVMLQIIDQRWRDHLSDMDYLREGINLRAMGQQDPLVAWQRDGFSMFEKLVESVDDDYLRYVLHVEAVVNPVDEPDLSRAVYEAAEDPVTGTLAMAPQLLADQGVSVDAISNGLAPTPRADGPPAARAQPPAGDEVALVPTVKAPNEKLGRNAPCWCGSGKKFKLCHGAA
ncbi:MAG: SEC-C metal-binding domain-containing protein, partial [Acidimicrobiales bacterium]